MKSIASAIIVILAYNVSFAHDLKLGRFTGQGSWRSQEKSGVYIATTEITTSEISSSYQMKDSTESYWKFITKNKRQGFFDVMNRGQKIGQGYCLKNALVCHYDIKIGKFTLEESLVQENGLLYRYGSKNESGQTIVWQEALKQVNVK